MTSFPYVTPYGDWGAPATEAADVSPNDSEDLPWVARFLWVGVGGDVTVMLPNSSTELLFKVSDGSPLPVAVARVMATGTTATNIVACR